jgi:multiple sugar transport system substrate-binding protein
MRLRSLSGALAVLVLATLVGCGRDAPQQTGKVTVTWWDYFGYSPTADRAVTRLLEKYQSFYPEIEVKRTTIKFSEFRPTLLRAAANGTFPDVAAIDNADVPVFAGQDAIADLTSRMRVWQGRVTFLDPVQRSVQFGDKAYGIPFRSNTTALWYNKALFAAAGVAKPPATWDELRITAKKLTTDKQAGFCFSAAPTEEGTFTLLPMLWQAGSDVASIGDQASIDALTMVNTLVNTDKSAPADVLHWGQSEVDKQFHAGRCAMMINGPWVLHSVASAGFAFDVAPWPAGSGGTASPLGGEVLAVGKNSRHLDAAWQLTTWLADPANSLGEVYRELGGIPNRTTTIEDPAWAWHPVVTAFAQQMRTARPRGVYGAKYPEISQVISAMEQQVLASGRAPAEAAAEASGKIKQLLGR